MLLYIIQVYAAANEVRVIIMGVFFSLVLTAAHEVRVINVGFWGGESLFIWGSGGPGFAATLAVRVIRVLSHFQYLQLYATHSGHMSSRFEKLVKLIGTQLTHHIYDFITYVQVGTTARSNKRGEVTQVNK